MASIRFRCVSCGFALHCDEGAGEPYTCPKCGFTGTVPAPPVADRATNLRRIRTADAIARAAPAGEALPELTEKEAFGWRRVRSGLRLLRTSHWLLLGLAVLLALLGVLAVLSFGDGLRWTLQDGSFTPTGLTVACLAAVFAGALLLQDLVSLICYSFCLFVPHRKGLAIAVLVLAVVSLAWLGLAAVLSPFLGKGMKPAQALVTARGLVLAVNVLGFVKWLTFVCFLRSAARQLGDRRLVRNLFNLMAVAALVEVFYVLSSGLQLTLEAMGGYRDADTVRWFLGLEIFVVSGGALVLGWYLYGLSRCARVVSAALART